jgi:hypothetical protein
MRRKTTQARNGNSEVIREFAKRHEKVMAKLRSRRSSKDSDQARELRETMDYTTEMYRKALAILGDS